MALVADLHAVCRACFDKIYVFSTELNEPVHSPKERLPGLSITCAPVSGGGSCPHGDRVRFRRDHTRLMSCAGLSDDHLAAQEISASQRETLFTFHTGTDEQGARQIDVQPAFEDVQPTVILGVHTCDMHGIMLYDKVFTRGVSGRALRRPREQTYIVGSSACAHATTRRSARTWAR